MTDRFLSTRLRRALERDVHMARKVAEAGVSDAVRRLGVAEAQAPPHLSGDDKAARRRLRAHARALGDSVTAGIHTVDHLIEAAAYAQWRRRLFARFLAERGLLRRPDHDAPITLIEVEAMAADQGFADGWAAAEAHAARLLPAVFQPDDPVLALTLSPEPAQALRRLALGIDAEIFQADDALGWTYQFWRTARKKQINGARKKIGARELPAVTQLFTEPYMVKFLLHNTLGAWCAGRVLAARPALATGAADEAALRAAVSPKGYAFDMLRFVREGSDGPWQAAAGTFPGWPDRAAQIRALDPCCGSGHFLTEMLAILTALRADEEGLSESQAVAAVLSDNLFGLELDGRCVQIAAFAVALTAWRIGGFQPFAAGVIRIAWVGRPPSLDRAQFETLGDGDGELRQALGHLHDLFGQAPLLGSLIEPTDRDNLGPKVMGRLEASLSALIDRTRSPASKRAEGAAAARGMAHALAVLCDRYSLIATNVPFLGRGKQGGALKAHIERHDADAKADLATAMLSRSLRLLNQGGALATVSPQNWLQLGAYTRFRRRLLSECSIDGVIRLGARAFGVSGTWDLPVTLSIISLRRQSPRTSCMGMDVSGTRKPIEKSNALTRVGISEIPQSEHLDNPDFRISTSRTFASTLLNRYAEAHVGLQNGDAERWLRQYWEPQSVGDRWSFCQLTTPATMAFAGRTSVVRWENGSGDLVASTGARIQGCEAWGKQGVIVRQLGLPCSLYVGDIYDQASAVIVPKDADDLPAIWAFCSSPDYVTSVRRIDGKPNVTNATMVKVPFDIDRWSRIAAQRLPDGIPEPYSDDPTQWLFHGHPAKALAGTQLHVALARLAGYRWPAESQPDMRLSVEARDWIAKAAALPASDADGVLPLSAVGDKRALGEHLRDYLNIAVPGRDEADLVRETDALIDRKIGRDLSMEGWLRDRAFRQHAALFHNRPFLWQVWDGQKDGFSAFLNYRRLDHAALHTLTFTLLGAWITGRRGETDERVEAAKILQKKLEAILDGEAPLDIFVRWKPLAQQPIGWSPDLDDGVRLNIRPWVTAEVLREASPKGISWGVDRGRDVASSPWFSVDQGARNNQRHTTLAEKRLAREAAVLARRTERRDLT